MKIAILLLPLIAAGLGFYYFRYVHTKSIHYLENKEVFANPYKGFVPLLKSIKGYEKIGLTLPVNMLYSDFTWAQLEPKAPGDINWSVIEEGMQEEIKKGRMFGLRFKVADPWVEGDLDIPEWLVELGVGVHRYNIDGGTGLLPDWDSPIFLEHHHRIMQEIGKRYNKNPHIAWIDIGTYGIWGEWHVYKNEHLKAKNQDSKKKILDSYFEAFPNKPMVIAFDDDWATGTVLSKNQGLRDDCLGTMESNKWFLESIESKASGFWENIPIGTIITGEYCGGDEGSLKSLREQFHENLKFIKKTQWLFIGPAGGNFVIAKDKDLVKAKEFYNHLGYHFIVRTATIDSKNTIHIKIENTGSSAFPLEWPITVHEGESTKQLKNIDIRTWKPGVHEFSFQLTKNYKGALSISISDPLYPSRKILFANTEQKDGIMVLKN